MSTSFAVAYGARGPLAPESAGYQAFTAISRNAVESGPRGSCRVESTTKSQLVPTPYGPVGTGSRITGSSTGGGRPNAPTPPPAAPARRADQRLRGGARGPPSRPSP